MELLISQLGGEIINALAEGKIYVIWELSSLHHVGCDETTLSEGTNPDWPKRPVGVAEGSKTLTYQACYYSNRHS